MSLRYATAQHRGCRGIEVGVRMHKRYQRRVAPQPLVFLCLNVEEERRNVTEETEDRHMISPAYVQAALRDRLGGMFYTGRLSKNAATANDLGLIWREAFNCMRKNDGPKLQRLADLQCSL